MQVDFAKTTTSWRRIVVELGALQAEVDALKRLQAETPVNKITGQAAADPPSFDFGATGLDALLPAILDKDIRTGIDSTS